jgi:hypothetical protein
LVNISSGAAVRSEVEFRGSEFDPFYYVLLGHNFMQIVAGFKLHKIIDLSDGIEASYLTNLRIVVGWMRT